MYPRKDIAERLFNQQCLNHGLDPGQVLDLAAKLYDSDLGHIHLDHIGTRQRIGNYARNTDIQFSARCATIPPDATEEWGIAKQLGLYNSHPVDKKVSFQYDFPNKKTAEIVITRQT